MPSMLNNDYNSCINCDLVKKKKCERIIVLSMLERMAMIRHKGAPIINGTTIRYCAEVGLITLKDAESIINKIGRGL